MEAPIAALRRAITSRPPRRSLGLAMQLLRARVQLRRCTSVGPWCRVIGRVRVVNRGGRIVLGERVRFHAHLAPSLLAVFKGGRLEIGDRTFLNYGLDVAATELVSIGADCLLGTHVMILDNDFHDLNDRERVPPARPVRIGDRVWIGSRSIILPGVSIGPGAVIGAGSVVTADVPERAVAAGNPARVVKTLDDRP